MQLRNCLLLPHPLEKTRPFTPFGNLIHGFSRSTVAHFVRCVPVRFYTPFPPRLSIDTRRGWSASFCCFARVSLSLSFSDCSCQFLIEEIPLTSKNLVGGNAVSAFLSWRLQSTNACDVTLVWKSGFESVAQYGISFRYCSALRHVLLFYLGILKAIC